MPPTPEELEHVTRAVATDVLAPDCIPDIIWLDGTAITAREQCEIVLAVIYDFPRRRRRVKHAQRKAMRLLRSYLSADQRRQLRQRGEFMVHASHGGVYRICPSTGNVWGVELHGRHYFGVRTYCYHDPENELPDADLSVAHLMLLSCDEPAFLAAANVRERPPQCWDGEWLRTLAAARRDRRPAVPAPDDITRPIYDPTLDSLSINGEAS